MLCVRYSASQFEALIAIEQSGASRSVSLPGRVHGECTQPVPGFVSDPVFAPQQPHPGRQPAGTWQSGEPHLFAPEARSPSGAKISGM
jgi:hypothetical protein